MTERWTRALLAAGLWRRGLPGAGRAEKAGPALGWAGALGVRLATGASAGAWASSVLAHHFQTGRSGPRWLSPHWEEGLRCQKWPRVLQALGGQQDVGRGGWGSWLFRPCWRALWVPELRTSRRISGPVPTFRALFLWILGCTGQGPAPSVTVQPPGPPSRSPWPTLPLSPPDLSLP